MFKITIQANRSGLFQVIDNLSDNDCTTYYDKDGYFIIEYKDISLSVGGTYVKRLKACTTPTDIKTLFWTILAAESKIEEIIEYVKSKVAQETRCTFREDFKDLLGIEYIKEIKN